MWNFQILEINSQIYDFKLDIADYLNNWLLILKKVFKFGHVSQQMQWHALNYSCFEQIPNSRLHFFPVAVGFFNRLCTGPRDLYVILACIEFCKIFVAYWICACSTFHLHLWFFSQLIKVKITAQRSGLLKRCLRT